MLILLMNDKQSQAAGNSASDIPPDTGIFAIDFSAIDRHALNAPGRVCKRISLLSAYLCSGARNDRDKARAIYRWIADNIRYDTKQYFSGTLRSQNADDVLQTKQGVCAAYSNLFQSLAEQGGLKCVTIAGHGKGYSYTPGDNRLETNHDWNAVKIDGVWQLIDSTWGAGYISENNKFTPAFDDFYFCTSPFFFIYSHLPAEPHWQLLEKPVSKETYLGMLAVKSDFFRYGIRCENYRQVVITCEYKIKILLEAPDFFFFAAELEELPFPGKRYKVFVQRAGKVVEFHAIMAKAGNYILTIFVKTRNRREYHDVIRYLVAAKKGTHSGERVPESFETFTENYCYLLEPLNGHLPRNRETRFRIIVPGARDVAVICNKEWSHLRKVREPVFEGNVYIPGGEVTVFGKYHEGNSYSALLRFHA